MGYNLEDEHKLNEELENYFANTIIPQLFIDAKLKLRKFTPPAMTQFTLTEADINKDINDVSDNFCYPTLIENIQEVITTGEILEKEIQTTDKRWFQMNILPYLVQKENKTNGVIITFIDITNRLATLKELEKLNSEHNILMFSLSHDIKQPLSTLYLLSDELFEAFNKNDQLSFKKWIDKLNRSSESIKELINDFAERINSKEKVQTKNERVNIEQIFNDVILALKDDLYENDVNIKTNFTTSEIIFPRTSIRSIVYNLLSNAIKYRNPDKNLKISIKTHKKDNFVILTVQDNGVGINKQYHEDIFKKNVRLNNTIEGTGLGLYILKRMLIEKDGKVEVKSTPGEGSTFKLYFKSSY